MAGAQPAASSLGLVERMLAGDMRALGRLLTRLEEGLPEVRDAAAELYHRGGRAHLVGITGVPGSGKSTLVSELVREIRKRGRRVGVVAVDPSSPFSGGAILGDRIRMDDLTSDDGVFIRSMGSRGAMGGLAQATLAIVDALDVAGYDVIVIETVGVGQDEVEIAKASHTTVVVSPPGLGDDVQAIKAGVLEIADIHVVSKADRPDANRTIADLRTMIGIGAAVSESARRIPIVPCSAHTGTGIGELLVEIDRHGTEHRPSEAGRARARRIAEYRALKTAEGILRRRFSAAADSRLGALVESVVRREIDPETAVMALFAESGFQP